MNLMGRQVFTSPIVKSPKQRGFGCELIERAIPYEFDGEASLYFVSAGVEADFWIPSNLVQWGEIPDTLQEETSVKNAASTAVANEDIGAALVVEDNMLIAMEMECSLKTMGFKTVDSAPSVTRALKLLNSHHYRICFLDIDLKKETSFEIAYELVARQVPFVFTSGYDSKYPIPKNLKSMILIKKPVDSEKLKDVVENILKF
ncbi:MAG: response regulator [Symploca sp. SIO2G7]|nr:response regulator [Symploca sp. SIO2G7]